MSDIEIDIDNLLKQYERACAAVVEKGDANLSETTKERAFYRNEIRALLVRAAWLRDVTVARLREDVTDLEAINAIYDEAEADSVDETSEQMLRRVLQRFIERRRSGEYP